MKYDAINEERKWWDRTRNGNEKSKSFAPRHYFAHSRVHSSFHEILVTLTCGRASSILDIGCGAGKDVILEVSENLVGVDVSCTALKRFISKGFRGVLADAKRLPFHSNFFDYVIAADLLHHLRGQGDLMEYLTEFVRVLHKGGYVVALEPSCFHPSGILMNIFNTIKPGITGLVPHERALSPLYLAKIFRKAGLKDVKCISASYVWNRFPLAISKFISKHESKIRFKKPFNLFGWFVIVYGEKAK